MARVAHGDKPALAELYDRTSTKLFGVCLRICRHRSTAEDVLQEVYIKVWHRADQFRAGDNSPISWLSAIARNASIDWLRKNGRHVQEDDSALEAMPDPQPLGDAVLEAEQQSAKIAECLDQLSDEQKQPIRSAFFSGLTYSELAKQGNSPLSTVKSRIRRGLMNLKKCIENG
ncbi:sigma-70 family RNA polymerase sigma factor [Parasphingorhabdus sp.]|uniref:sigma-70 family RNA polymerase sigma factor n=1 Tax=Parasphingorhabdus sp. TaxID=2709688 RepID=UPI0030032F16